jgi:hypothetical protein
MPLPLSICMQLEAAGIGWPACTCRHRWFPFCCHGTGNASHHRLNAHVLLSNKYFARRTHVRTTERIRSQKPWRTRLHAVGQSYPIGLGYITRTKTVTHRLISAWEWKNTLPKDGTLRIDFFLSFFLCCVLPMTDLLRSGVVPDKLE